MLAGLVLVLGLAAGRGGAVAPDVEAGAAAFMDQLDRLHANLSNRMEVAAWQYTSNLTDHNLQVKLNVATEVSQVVKEKWSELIKFPWQEFKDPDLKRKFDKYSKLGTAALSDEKLRRLNEIIAEMEGVYGTAKICDFKKRNLCTLSLEPDLSRILQESRDPEELKHVWVEWRRASGRKMRKLYEEYVELVNEAARKNNFTDNAESWKDDFESDSFEEDMGKLWREVEPLYSQLHAYVRSRLRRFYGDKVVPRDGPIPAHLLGNMWSQTWSNVLNLTVPYPEKESVDVTPQMVKQGYTPLKMFKQAEEFFTSLNLTAMPDTFWQRSIIEKPSDRELICHASAWDFYDAQDVRIKMCTVVTQEDFETVHHEMGHIQYFLQYSHQPTVYRRGANSGFHEAIGDVMSLSVSTPKHLKRIGLLPSDFQMDQEAIINHLFLTALDKVAVLPFVYLVDQWRWDVFKGNISPDQYNHRWWQLRMNYQGLSPAADRSEDDFDPGAKYHIPADVPYVRYFVSHILQFQFHKALCVLAGEFDPARPEDKPLHNCDIYQSTAAGNKLGDMLQLGSSKPWPEALTALTGSPDMSAKELLEYFQPLHDWLVKENLRQGETPGWTTSDSPKF